MYDESGKISSIIVITKDITDRKNAEKKIETLLAEKEILLKEVHHRIKNNMGSIYSLLGMQARTSKNAETSRALDDASSRIYTMTHLYDILYRSPELLERISLKNYFSSLVDEIGAV